MFLSTPGCCLPLVAWLNFLMSFDVMAHGGKVPEGGRKPREDRRRESSLAHSRLFIVFFLIFFVSILRDEFVGAKSRSFTKNRGCALKPQPGDQMPYFYYSLMHYWVVGLAGLSWRTKNQSASSTVPTWHQHDGTYPSKFSRPAYYLWSSIYGPRIMTSDGVARKGCQAQSRLGNTKDY